MWKTHRISRAGPLWTWVVCSLGWLAVAGVAPAQSAPINGVMMQAFYWDVPQTTPAGSWWKNLESKAQEFSDIGVTAVWLPPPYKGRAGASDVGYGVYDRYDLGEFNQCGTVPTRYGTLAELQDAIQAMKDKNIQVYIDIVMNHMMGADQTETFTYNGETFNVPTKFTFPGRGTTYSNYQWRYYNFNGVQLGDGSWKQWHANWDFPSYHDAWDNLMGCEIRFQNPDNRKELIAWGKWITGKLGVDGYRLDATKHMYTPFVIEWLDNVKGNRFAVSEALFGDLGDLKNYAQALGSRSSLFDFPLHYRFGNVLNKDGSGDLRKLKFAGFTEVNGPRSVSFVDNHDTDRSSPVVKMKMLAYAYILTRHKGYPCVFYKDYYEYNLGSQIKKLIEIRKNHAYGGGWEYDQTDADVYVFSRAGDQQHRGLLLLLCDAAATSKQLRTPFLNATLKDHTGHIGNTVTTDASGVGVFPVPTKSYAVWVPEKKPTTAVTFHVTYGNTQPGQDVYLIGNTQQLGQWNTNAAIRLSGAAWPQWTVTVDLDTGVGVAYKYICKDAAGNVRWEGGSDRVFTPAGTAQDRHDSWQP